MKLNVIIPCFNEEGNVELLHKKLTETLADLDYKLIFVNDGSNDKTAYKLRDIYNKDMNNIQVINFSRNFGKDAAIYAGLKHSNADYTVIIDGDLQQNPKYLLDMISFLDKNENTDVVAMVNKTRDKEGLITRFLKWGFYTFMNIISDIKFAKSASDFRMFRRNVVEAILSLPENNRFSKGVFSWIGFETHLMDYKVEARNSGKTKFNFRNQWRYAFKGIVNFSVKPLRIATVLGFLFAFIAFVYILIVTYQTLIYGNDVPGYPTLISVILLLGGFQLMAIGVLGEYISKTYLEAKKRPIYVTKNKLGFDDELL